MKKLHYVALSALAVGLIGASAVGIASAASIHGNVGTSGIPRSVFMEERLDAASQVLNTTTANIQAAHKDKTFSSLLSQANLTKQTYAEKLKAQLTSDLEAKGYSQDQITIALQHKLIRHLRHNHRR